MPKPTPDSAKEGVVIPFAPRRDCWTEKRVVAETASRDYERGFDDGLRVGFKARAVIRKRTGK